MTIRDDNGLGASQVDDAVVTLRARIIDLSLEPGCRLDERMLAQRFGIGRTPAREALNRLAMEGFVEIRPRREGTYVAPLGLRQFAEVIEANQFCETMLGHRARLDDPSLHADMRAIQDRYIEAVEQLDHARITALNVEFHMRAYVTMDNGLITEFAHNVLRHAARLLNYTYRHEQAEPTLHRAQFAINLAQHEALLQAVAAGDAAAFRRELIDHVQYLHHRLALLLDRRRVDGMEFPDPPGSMAMLHLRPGS